jgi:hypothetical protein
MSLRGISGWISKLTCCNTAVCACDANNNQQSGWQTDTLNATIWLTPSRTQRLIWDAFHLGLGRETALSPSAALRLGPAVGPGLLPGLLEPPSGGQPVPTVTAKLASLCCRG